MPTLPASAAASPAPVTSWQNDRFGLFLHWGIYSHTQGEWRGQSRGTVEPWTGKPFTEFIQIQARIPLKDYSAHAGTWNPALFNADAWVQAAKSAGMRYIVITSKHHEGFALFKSFNPYNIVDHTPFKRDVIKELADACARHGLKFCVYYSLGRDWHDPDCPTDWPFKGGRSNTVDYPDEDAKVISRYVDRKVIPQVRELLTNYGPITMMWFDTPGLIPKADSQRLRELIKSLQPDCLINDRIGNGLGDVLITEQKLLDKIETKPWEACLTMSQQWGYSVHDKNWKTPEALIRHLVDITAKGGNYLLNIGPQPEGVLPPPSLERLAAIGAWMKVNGEAIYESRPWHVAGESFVPPTSAAAAAPAAADADTTLDATPKGLEPDLRFTTRAGCLYVIARSWQKPTVTVKALALGAPYAMAIGGVTLLGSTQSIVWKQTAEALTLEFPAQRPGAIPVHVFKITPK